MVWTGLKTARTGLKSVEQKGLNSEKKRRRVPRSGDEPWAKPQRRLRLTSPFRPRPFPDKQRPEPGEYRDDLFTLAAAYFERYFCSDALVMIMEGKRGPWRKTPPAQLVRNTMGIRDSEIP